MKFVLFAFIQCFPQGLYHLSTIRSIEEGATMNPMSNVRGREALNEAPCVVAGRYAPYPRHGEPDGGNEGEGLNTNS